MAAFDISTELPKLDRPITGIRVVIHPVADLPGGGWGSGPDEGKRAKAKKPIASNALQNEEQIESEKKGIFMLTFSAARNSPSGSAPRSCVALLT